MIDMRHNVRSFVIQFSKYFDLMEPIIEIGAFRVPGQENRANLRPFFPGKKYIGCDTRPGLGVDEIENVEHLSFEDNSIGSILIMETLEHVQNCFNALDEIYRVLKINGILVMSSAMNYVIHNHPSDYWRFTPAAFTLLLDKFPIKLVGYQGTEKFPHTIFGIGIKSFHIDENIQTKFQMLHRYKEIVWI